MIRSIAAAAVACGLLVAGSALAQQAPPKAAVPEVAKPSAFTAAQREELKKLIHEYIVQNPEVLNDGIAALEAKEKAAAEAREKEALAKNAKALNDSPEGTVLGNPKGDVTLVEFFDYNCGWCKKMFVEMMDAVKADGKVRVVMKEFPVLDIPGTSETAAKAALASVKQGKYPAFHTALMTNKGGLSDEAIMKVAAEVGLDVKKLQADMKSADHDKVIDKNHTMGHDLGIHATPAMVISGELIPGGGWVKKDFQDLIEKARTKTGK